MNFANKFRAWVSFHTAGRGCNFDILQKKISHGHRASLPQLHRMMGVPSHATQLVSSRSSKANFVGLGNRSFSVVYLPAKHEYLKSLEYLQKLIELQVLTAICLG